MDLYPLRGRETGGGGGRKPDLYPGEIPHPPTPEKKKKSIAWFVGVSCAIQKLWFEPQTDATG